MSQSTIEPPFYPIIYVRGYAMTGREVEDAVSCPYMGFNLGSTKVRQSWDGRINRFIFESPMVRLMKDHGYHDIYSDGSEIPSGGCIPARSVVVYRYYEGASDDLNEGQGQRQEILEYAKGLSELILQVREQVCRDDADARPNFRVCLAAHSMGGLICRCFLQNPNAGTDEARKLVDKVFTYATPHNGIDMKVIGNVPGFFTANNANTFNRKYMREYLALPGQEGDRVDGLNNRFDPERFFCLIGTNGRDYAASDGWVTRVVGELSDGLVRIDNAAVRSAPRALVHRSHSGHYGIVNSEEGYQNLQRFLFGDARVDGVLKVKSISLPPKVQALVDDGKKLKASYHVEVVVRVRGTSWDLHRRTVAEHSAIFRTHEELTAGDQTARHPHLFSTFLSTRNRVNKKRQSLGFSIDLGVLVPEYTIDKTLWLDDHYDGGYLFRDKINVEVIPPKTEEDDWRLRYGFDSRTPNRASTEVAPVERDKQLIFTIPIQQNTRPGIDAELELTAQPWNSTE